MDKAQNNELDEQLKQLAISAQQHPALTQPFLRKSLVMPFSTL